MKRPKTTAGAAGASADGNLAPVAIVEVTARYCLSIMLSPMLFAEDRSTSKLAKG